LLKPTGKMSNKIKKDIQENQDTQEKLPGFPSLPPFHISLLTKNSSKEEQKSISLDLISNIDLALELGGFCLKYNRNDIDAYLNDDNHVCDENFLLGLYNLASDNNFDSLYEQLLEYVLIYNIDGDGDDNKKINKFKLIWNITNKVKIEEELNIRDNSDIKMKDFLICLENLKINWYNSLNIPKKQICLNYTNLRLISSMIENNTAVLIIECDHKININK
jgi:hypothetical protein